MGSTGNITFFDFIDTYLSQWREPMVDSLAAGTMCSYMATRIVESPDARAVPSCASPYLLTTIVREWYGRPDAIHLSDCGAVVNMARPLPRGNGFANGSFVTAAAVALNAGMDQNSNTVSPAHMRAALAAGLTTPATVRAAAARVLAKRFQLGHFDPLEAMPPALRALDASALGTAANAEVAADAVRQGTVLLKNSGVLPLRAGASLAVVGPGATSVTAMLGDLYANTDGLCPSDGSDCYPTVGAALAAANVGGATAVEAGVGILANSTGAAWADALAAARGADAVVLALATDRSVAGEGNDRDDIGLPGTQSAFALAVLAAAAARGAPVVLLLVHNLPVSFDELLAAAAPPAAVVDAWAPTTHAAALAGLLFGAARGGWGRAPLTVYPRAYARAVALDDFAMPPHAAVPGGAPASPGRSYRWYDESAGAPLVRFGEGLSGFSTFSLACAGARAGARVAVNCTVTHAGGPGGDEVLMVFHRAGADVVARVGGAHPVPRATLRDFARVAVGAGGAEAVSFDLDAARALALTDAAGAQRSYAGTHYLDVWNGNSQKATVAVALAPADEGATLTPPPYHT